VLRTVTAGPLAVRGPCFASISAASFALAVPKLLAELTYLGNLKMWPYLMGYGYQVIVLMIGATAAAPASLVASFRYS